MATELPTELYRHYRPQKLADVLGQTRAISTLRALGKKNSFPHAVLFSGPSGCGKTTLARIIRKKLGCNGSDFVEVNSADFRGIEFVRELAQRIHLAPLAGRARIWLLDEAHQLTGAAQDALLKVLEDTPSHVYFIICSTEPQKLRRTIRTRTTEIKLQPLKLQTLTSLVNSVATSEHKTITSQVTEAIAERAEGSARMALVLLQQIIGLSSDAEQLAALTDVAGTPVTVQIAKALCDSRTTWPDIAALLRKNEDPPETIRRIVLGWASKRILNRVDNRVVAVLQHFRDNFDDCGHAGLVLACHEVLAT